MSNIPILYLTSEIPPSVNHYLVHRGIVQYKNKKPYALVTVYETTEAKQYKKKFQEYAKEQVKLQNWDIEKTKNKHHYLIATWYFPRIDMDDQNYYKCLSDSLNDIAYYDDQYILVRTNRVFYDGKNPHVDIQIMPVEYVGVFDNEQQFNEFKETCQQCQRYSKNCSILNKAVDGRIQEEIVNNKCLKFKENKK